MDRQGSSGTPSDTERSRLASCLWSAATCRETGEQMGLEGAQVLARPPRAVTSTKGSWGQGWEKVALSYRHFGVQYYF